MNSSIPTSASLRQEVDAGSCEKHNYISGPTKSGYLPKTQSECTILTKGSAPLIFSQLSPLRMSMFFSQMRSFRGALHIMLARCIGGPQSTPRCKKVKGKGRLWVLQHCCLKAYCTLTRMSSFIHLKRRCTHQTAWETSASEGRNYIWNLFSNP